MIHVYIHRHSYSMNIMWRHGYVIMYHIMHDLALPLSVGYLWNIHKYSLHKSMCSIKCALLCNESYQTSWIVLWKKHLGLGSLSLCFYYLMGNFFVCFFSSWHTFQFCGTRRKERIVMFNWIRYLKIYYKKYQIYRYSVSKMFKK